MKPGAARARIWQRMLGTEGSFALGLTSLVGLLGGFGLSRHAMWRDELNAWLVATDSTSWRDLLANVRYEGHPLLWYLSLAAVKQLWDDPRAMQLLHLSIGLGSVWLVLRYAPLARWQRILFAFGYLPFYEYLLISRNYAWGLFSLLLFCVLWPTRRRSYLGLAIALVLAANANAYCFAIAIALSGTLLIEARLQRSSAALWDRALSAVLVLSGLAIALATILPPADSQLQGGLSENWTLHFNLRHLLATLVRVWNSYIVVLIPGDSQYWAIALFAILSALLLAAGVTRFWQQPAILWFYSSATAAILGLTYAKFLGSPRHFGHLFLILFVALWLSRDSPSARLAALLPHQLGNGFKTLFPCPAARHPLLQSWRQLVRRYQATGFAAILLGQTLGGLVAFSRDLVVPYSAGRATAQLIQTQGWEGDFIVGSEDKVMATLAGYLGRDLYYPETQSLGSFVLFTRDRRSAPLQEIFAQIDALLRDRDSLLLVLNYELHGQRDDLAIVPLAQLTDSLIFNEKFFLYRVKSVDSLPTLNRASPN